MSRTTYLNTNVSSSPWINPLLLYLLQGSSLTLPPCSLLRAPLPLRSLESESFGWNKTTREVMFYLSSLAADAAYIGRAVRAHWGIENQLHWVLDVTFCEDDSRIRTLNGSENFS